MTRRAGRSHGPTLLGFLLLTAALGVAGPVLALDVPALRGHVNDYAQLLSGASAQQLEARLAAFEAKTQHQFVLLTIASLEGQAIEPYSMSVVERWKLGRKKPDDGLLMLIAAQDHKMRIEVGYGLEGEIPDAIAARVIREVLTPAFKRGEFSRGIEAGFHVLIQAAGGDGQALSTQQQPRGTMGASGLFVWGVFLLVVLGMLLFGRFGRRGYYGGFGGGFGGGGGFSGGGGGFSGGGGGFGGGGASGSW